MNWFKDFVVFKEKYKDKDGICPYCGHNNICLSCKYDKENEKK